MNESPAGTARGASAAHSRHVRNAAAAAAALGLAAVMLPAGYPGAAAVSVATSIRGWAATPRPPAGDLPWIHVEHGGPGGPYLADDGGRAVILRGVVAPGLVDYWSGVDPADLQPGPALPMDPRAYEGACPASTPRVWIPPLCRDDLRQMHGMGVNVLRLPLSWSLLEPAPGAYDATYLARIRQVVGWAREERIHVIVDLHQNAYSRYLGRADPGHLPLPLGRAPALSDTDGAPAWASLADGLPSEKFGGQRELNPAVFEAATNFWLNREGIQDRYIAAMARVVGEFRDDSTVVGFSPFNEPWPGWVPPPLFDDLLLMPFYRRVIDASTGAADGVPCPRGLPYAAVCGYRDLGVHDTHHLFFLEPGLLREVTDFPTHLPVPVSSYPNLVLSMHAYTHIYTLDALAGVPAATSSWPPFSQSYDWAEREAVAMRAALFVSEFGNDPRDDGRLLASQLDEQDRHGLGSTFWVWKQNCGYGRTWGVYEGLYPDGTDARCAYDRPDAGSAPKERPSCVRAARAALLDRPVPRALPRGAFSFRFDRAAGRLEVQGRAERAQELTVFLPGDGRLPAGLASTSGVRSEPAGGGVLVHVPVREGGYRVRFSGGAGADLDCAGRAA